MTRIENSDTQKKEEQEEIELYGCGPCKPRCLQFFNKIQWNVFWQCIFNFFEGFIVNGVVNVIIPALEKRYNMSSKRSAIIASSNDFGAFVFFIFVGYVGERIHKPKLMAGGVLIMSLGSLLFLLPHFIGDKYQYIVSDSNSNGTESMCSANPASSNGTCGIEATDSSSYSGYYAMFILGQMFHGIGAVPMFTIALTYIDENCKQKLTSLYVSLTFCAAAVGVAVGYIVGGQTLGIFVDIDKESSSSVPLTPTDPQWVGAWWIGVVVSFFAFFFIFLPILGFPKRLPGYAKLQREKRSEAHNASSDEANTRPNFGSNIKDLPRAIWTLIKNPTYVFIILGATIELMVVGGLAVFGAKLLHVLFNVDLTTAGTVMGIVTIPGSGGGMLLGGYLVKRLHLRCRSIIRLCVICLSLCILFSPSYLINCPDKPLAGVTTNYINNNSTVDGLVSTCNAECKCTTAAYEPICDVDKTAFFSPCHAGCRNISTINSVKSFYGCSCIENKRNTSTSVPDAVNGSCAEQCVMFYVFCVLLFFTMFLTFMTMSPVVTSMFRCVSDDQRSLAIGIQLLIGRVLGTTPGPVLLGAIIDSACNVWQDDCGTTGSCWIYRKSDLGLRLMIWWLSLKSVGVLFFYTASKVYKAPESLHKEIEDTKL